MKGKSRTYAVRIKTKNGLKTVFIEAKDHKRAAGRVKENGQIMFVRKVDCDELFSMDLLKMIVG